MTPKEFNQTILAWYQKHGRQTLPWRQEISAYRVWISEIMLQQTQVATVIPYFARFIARFPDLPSLAKAPVDEVLTLWAGLGYYSRARNLHKTAKLVMEQWGGVFPNNVDNLQQLPGIGRSTAGAIAAIAFNTQAPILDGNVKRVLARFAAIDGWPNKPAVLTQLWELATQLTPKTQVADYTQAMMDLGATLCKRSQPQCSLCPVQAGCVANKNQQQHLYPEKKPKKTIPEKPLILVLLCNQQQQILLEKRPPAGIWGGLWSFPECPDLSNITQWCKANYYCVIQDYLTLPSFRHTLSHFHLDITPIVVTINKWQPPLMDNPHHRWHNIHSDADVAFAAPIKRLMQQLKETGQK